MSQFIAAIPAVIVLRVAVIIGIGATLLGIPSGRFLLIALFGVGGAVVAIRVFS